MKLKQTAYHEAGHAVIGRVLKLRCGGASIVKNVAEGQAGHAIIADPNASFHDWDRELYEQVFKRGDLGAKARDLHSAYRALIIARMAGAEAESVLLGSCLVGDASDRYEIALLSHPATANFLMICGRDTNPE